MVDWNCTSDVLSKGERIIKYRQNGVYRYGIRVEHIIVEGAYVDLEIKFRDDWDKNTDYISLRSGGKWSYTDPDSGKWEIRVTSISGSGIWATATVELCYYGGPEASITDPGHDGSSRKAGELVDIHPDVCNIGNLAGTFDIKFYEGATLLATTGTGRLVAGACGNNYSTMLTMPDRDFVVTMKIYLRGTSIVYDEATATVQIETIVAGNGFTIRTSLELATKTVLVAHVVKMPFIGLVGPDPDLWYWPQAFDYVGGKWYMTDPATTYRVEVGSIFETIPSFDKTYGTGSFADGIHCVVLAVGEGGVGSLIFKGEDIFQLHRDSPTEIYLSSTSTDVLTEAVMGPVCDFFGIPRGSQCDSFWAEFYDPVYVANYISIRQTGKDTLGNARELSGFDHIALPFAVLGSLPGLSLLPFGALVTKGLGAVSKAGAKFGDEAVQFMLNFSMDSAGMISSKDTWYFLDAIGQVTEDHATEIVNALTAGDTTLANTLLRRYAGESKGWWDYHTLNDMLRDALPADAYNWLRTQIGLTEIGAGTVTNTAKQATLSADDLAKLADAAKDSGVMDEAVSAVYKSLVDMSGASATKVEELANILKNSPEISAKIGAKNTPMKHFVDLTEKHHDLIKNQLGQTKANSWFKNNAEIARKALGSADPAKMADIPHAAQEYAASYVDVATDMGGNIADDIVKATDDLVAQPTSNWRTTAKQTVKNTSNKFWNYFNSLSDVGQERVVHGMVAGTLVFSAVVLYKIYTDAGPQSLNHNLFTSKMESLYWPCFHACEDERADDLDATIKLYESVINECAESLYDYKDVLEADGTYEEFSRTLQIHQFNLSRLKSCLERLQPRGNIHCTSNEDFFYVDLDSQPAGFSYANREVLLRAVKVGSHTVKIHKHGYTPECTESVNVTEGTVKTVDCQMAETGACSPITAVSIYIDPLSPVEDQTVSFNGSAKSNDPITSWEWDFDDDFTATGQAVTHTYRSAGIYTVVLKVTNACGNSEFTTRNVTVSEEAPPIESTTLQIETPIGTDGNEIPRYWDIEIWVDGKDTACNPPKTLTFGTNVFCDCTSPWNLVPCELGQHTITLKKYGYDDKSISVYLRKDELHKWHSPVMVKSVAPPTQHTISFSVPVGSAVYIDGKPLTGTTTVGRLTTIFNELRKR